MNMNVQDLFSLGFFSALDMHLARTVAAASGDDGLELELAVALASRQVRRGDVCVRLNSLPRRFLSTDAQRSVCELDWPENVSWLDRLRNSPAVGSVGDFRPLIIDASGAVYLHRYHEHQRRLAEALGARAASVEDQVDLDWLALRLEALFTAPASSGDVDWQRVAVATAVLRKLAVISGGPGTGKTFTVAKILALAIEHNARSPQRDLRIALVAPTGKAAARLAQSIRQAKQSLAVDSAVLEQIPESASTIHRCLGARDQSLTKFRHHAANPLSVDLVVVDEASMVDIALMSRLVAATPEHAHLILLGDKDQLASVEAGAVLGDIFAAAQAQPRSADFVRVLQRVCRVQMPHQGSALSPHSGIWDCAVHLEHSFRYGTHSGIDRLARAINNGDYENAIDVLADPGVSDVQLHRSEERVLSGGLRRQVTEGYAPMFVGTDPAHTLQAFNRFRVLCAVHQGPRGTEALNAAIDAQFAGQAVRLGADSRYHGRPLMLSRNDYTLGLFNGDVGLLLASETDAAGFDVYFELSNGRDLRLAPECLPQHELAYANTVHKSQGSEHERVCLVLPDHVSELCTRELLYTAVTRAREHVSVFSSPEVLQAAVSAKIERHSGLQAALRAYPASS